MENTNLREHDQLQGPQRILLSYFSITAILCRKPKFQLIVYAQIMLEKKTELGPGKSKHLNATRIHRSRERGTPGQLKSGKRVKIRRIDFAQTKLRLHSSSAQHLAPFAQREGHVVAPQLKTQLLERHHAIVITICLSPQMTETLVELLF